MIDYRGTLSKSETQMAQFPEKEPASNHILHSKILKLLNIRNLC